ncbi:hypothetical protein SSOG_05380 [Streptomyces himastatinicus ATCC 53653]|uniref:Uncharacterized protein n=1 Tax=Streptomyces himastatinicus ATCC 53653 TaxID=457427 RepID=D9WKD2_9ACTN|nr:hypothetical protein [Streptomyces himastatinicus]EFL25666.1 hypothetical protein SSOG_05380 [Streptomyces himastatinicus ATCC 53653]
MSDAWRWEYDPDEAHVVAGLPGYVVNEVERIANELVDLAAMGVDVTDIGKGPQHGAPGGLRRLGIGGDGWLYFLAMPRLRFIVITRVIPPYEEL